MTRNTDIDLQRVAEAVALEQYDKLDALTLRLQEEINMGSGITGRMAELEARIAELEAQMSGTGAGEAVYSTLEGYFSSVVDGCEGTCTPARLQMLTCSDLQAMLTAEETPQEGLGKVVSGPEWYFALTIPSSEHKNYPEGSSVNLGFPGGGTVQGRVTRAELSDDGTVMMLVIKGDTVTEETVSGRRETVRLSSENYTGVRFPKDCLRIVNGVKGVYVDNGYNVKFKTVDIIYEGDTYYLSRLNYTGEAALNIFDKLVESKAELYDGMPLDDL